MEIRKTEIERIKAPKCSCGKHPHDEDCALIIAFHAEGVRRRRADIEEYQALYGGQGGFCPCCGRQESDYEENGHDPECIYLEEWK